MNLNDTVYSYDESSGTICKYEVRTFLAMGSDGISYFELDNGDEVYTKDTKIYTSEQDGREYYCNKYNAKQEALKYLDETIDYLASQYDSLKFYIEARKKLKEAE